MGDCKHCGTKAGLFKSHHKECASKYLKGTAEIIELVRSAGVNWKTDLKAIENDIKKIADSSYISSSRKHIIAGFERAVEHAFDDGILSENEEKSLLNLINHFDFEQSDLDANGAYSKIIKGAVLRDVMEGKTPDRINLQGSIPFNFQKSEQLIWLFQHVDYYEQKKRTHYVGGSQGFSVRIARGLYYRAGAFKGRRVEYNETVHADTGLLGITNKHLYFTGDSKSFRIRLDKIVSFEPYEEGIGVQRDAATAKPQIFKTGDGWFTHNLITNVAQL